MGETLNRILYKSKTTYKNLNSKGKIEGFIKRIKVDKISIHLDNGTVFLFLGYNCYTLKDKSLYLRMYNSVKANNSLDMLLVDFATFYKMENPDKKDTIWYYIIVMYFKEDIVSNLNLLSRGARSSTNYF